ncbi:FabD/lysophospholipase-like protein [Ascobolus immersus RN42]|uniref:FabD/lysophospholipase-like protein n=1 Tax=Ascobolus immersus RN42 TaxID=1160509 RepID=A0A3N4I547_ASCIM|nr:FabD/lysophospholipase-like protein [Ascobolus immersus RN42]
MRKILSLDGGGVRGLSTLIILRYIMEQLDEERGFHLEPWQEFDLIGGTSTGGLLAIMLGRLRMSIDECEDAYLQLSRRIFTPARKDVDVAGRVYDFLKANGKFDAKPLEEIVKHLLIERGLSEDELLLDKDEDSCKVFVCAVSGGNDSTVRIRTYKTRDHDPLLRHCKIWEAARATSAASRLFEPIKIGPRGQEFVDGALRHNNPIQIVDLESDELFRGEDRFIISIGTGSAPGSAVTGNLLELMQTLKKIVTDSEEKNQLFQAKNIDAVRTGRMYRFNVFHGLADVGLHEHEFTNLIADHTDAYLRMPDTRMQVMRCVATMKEAGQRLDYIGGEDLDIHLEKLRLGDVGAEICMHCQTGEFFQAAKSVC